MSFAQTVSRPTASAAIRNPPIPQNNSTVVFSPLFEFDLLPFLEFVAFNFYSTLANSRLRVNLRAFFHKLLRLGFHALLERLFLGDALFGGVFADVFGDLHRAEMRAAHGAEVEGVCGEGRGGLREGVKFPCWTISDLAP